MTDIEKAIKGLECCTEERRDCCECPYSGECHSDLMFDTLVLLKQYKTLLKKRKPVEPITDNEDGYWCGSCHEDMVWHQKYCSNCGRPVKWNDDKSNSK